MEAKGADVEKLWLPGDHYTIIDVASDDWLVELNAIFRLVMMNNNMTDEMVGNTWTYSRMPFHSQKLR